MADNKVKWVENEGVHELHFEPFYDDEILVKMVLIKDGEWEYVSNLLKVEDDTIYADDLNEAKDEIERKVAEYYQDQANYFDDLLDKFEEREQNG